MGSDFDTESLTKQSQRSPMGKLQKNLFESGGRLNGRTASGRNLFEVAFKSFEQRESDKNLVEQEAHLSTPAKKLMKGNKGSMKVLVMDNLKPSK